MQNEIPDYFVSDKKSIIYQNSLKKSTLFWTKKHRNLTHAFFKVQKHISFLKQILNFQTT